MILIDNDLIFDGIDHSWSLSFLVPKNRWDFTGENHALHCTRLPPQCAPLALRYHVAWGYPASRSQPPLGWVLGDMVLWPVVGWWVLVAQITRRGFHHGANLHGGVGLLRHIKIRPCMVACYHCPWPTNPQINHIKNQPYQPWSLTCVNPLSVPASPLPCWPLIGCSTMIRSAAA